MFHFEPLNDGEYIVGGDDANGPDRNAAAPTPRATLSLPSNTEREADVVDGMGGLASANRGYPDLDGEEDDGDDAIGAQIWQWEAQEDSGLPSSGIPGSLSPSLSLGSLPCQTSVSLSSVIHHQSSSISHQAYTLFVQL